MIRTVVRLLCAYVLLASLIEGVHADPVGPSPNKIPPGAIGIKNIGVSGSPPNTITGTVGSTSTKPLSAKYTISKESGSTWIVLKSGSITISSQADVTVTTPLQQENTMQTYKMEVSVPAYGISRSKQFSLAPAARRYTVQYGTREGQWVVAAVYSTENTPLSKVNAMATDLTRRMRDDGFETDLRVKQMASPFKGRYYRKSLYIRTTEMIVKSFPVPAAAVSFRSSLRRTVPSPDLVIEAVRAR